MCDDDHPIHSSAAIKDTKCVRNKVRQRGNDNIVCALLLLRFMKKIDRRYIRSRREKVGIKFSCGNFIKMLLLHYM